MQPFPTIAEAAREIATRRLSPVELARACLDASHESTRSFIVSF